MNLQKKPNLMILLVIVTLFLALVNIHSAYAENSLKNREMVLIDTANPPGIPSLTYPASSSTVTDYSPTLKWSKPTIPVGTTFDHYQVQLAADAVFTLILQDVNITDYYTPKYIVSPDLDPNMKIYWRVRACNALSYCSVWSGMRNFRTAILPPILRSPDDGSTVSSLRPTFDWEDVIGASGYTIQISKDSSFMVIVLATDLIGGTNSTYTPSSGLPANLPLYWRVKANGANGPSLWTNQRAFLTPNPPGVPTLTYPALSALIIDYSPTLKWSKPVIPIGTTFDHYQIQLSSDSIFSDIFVDVSLSDYYTSNYTVSPDLDSNLKIHWRVCACNSFGHCSNWSKKRNFRTSILPPFLSSPSDGSTVSSLRPTFDWEDVIGASGYTIQVAKDNAFTLITFTAEIIGGTNSIYSATTNLPIGTYFWRVKASGANGPSLWSAVSSFMTPNPPGIPQLISPASNVLFTDYNPSLQWSKPVVPSGTVFDHYQIQLATDSVFSNILQNSNVSDYNSPQYIASPDLNSNLKIFWRVQACNTQSHCSSWSTTRNFRTAILPPTLVTPEEGTVTTERRPSFEWDDVAGASGYTVQISNSSEFTTLLVDATLIPSSYSLVSDLPIGTFYWRVRANGTNGPSLWSDTRSFVREPTPGFTYYVSTTGSDANPGTRDAPWATIQKAADTMVTGGRVLVLAGTYDKRTKVTRSGSSEGQITFEAEGIVVTKGFTVQADYITIRGFEITNTPNLPADGIGIFVNGSYCVIEDNYIHYATRGGILIYTDPGEDTLIKDNVVRNNVLDRNSQFGIEIHGRNHVIEGNEISHTLQYHPLWVNPPNWVDADGIRFFGRGHIITGNFIHDITYKDKENIDPFIDCFVTYVVSPYYEAASNVVLEKNICKVAESLKPGMGGEAFALTGANHLIIRNNILHAFVHVGAINDSDLTIVNNVMTSDLSLPTENWPEAIYLENCANVIVKNNVFYDLPGHVYWLPDPSLPGLDIGYNLAYRSDGKPIWDDPYPNDLWEVDPLFVSPMASDYHLLSTSPMIDAGYNLGSVNSNDFDGNSRPLGTGYDIGAYEFLIQ